MKTVTIAKDELREIVQRNRDNHRSVFERAQDNYRAEVIKVLDQRLTAARNGEPVDVYIRLPQPEDHTEDYDVVLRMLDLSVDDTIELTYEEFQQYVMDQWRWHHSFMANTASYVDG